MKRLLAGAALAIAIGGPALAQPYPPVPPPRFEPAPPPPPGARYVWEPGHWHWNGGSYVWVGGHYVVRRPHWSHYVPGHWTRNPYGRPVWVPGHWA